MACMAIQGWKQDIKMAEEEMDETADKIDEAKMAIRGWTKHIEEAGKEKVYFAMHRNRTEAWVKKYCDFLTRRAREEMDGEGDPRVELRRELENALDMGLNSSKKRPISPTGVSTDLRVQ
jgi:predicted GTPase